MLNKQQNAAVLAALSRNDWEQVFRMIDSGEITVGDLVTEPGGNEFPLTDAAYESGNYEALRRLIDLGADVNRHPFGYALIVRAAGAGRTELVELLIKAGADVNVVLESDDGNTTALMSATKYPDIVKLLLAAGADPKALDDDGCSAMYPASGGKPEVIQMLLDAGCPVTGECLHMPVYRRELDLVQQLLAQKPDVNKGFPHSGYVMKGEKPLVIAVEKNMEDIRTPPPPRSKRLGIIKALLEAGADVNVRALSSFGRTPLLMAVEQRDAEIARILVQAGADPNEQVLIKTGRKTSAFELARSRGLEELVAAMQ